MSKFKRSLHFEDTVEAEDDEAARGDFVHEVIYDTQSDFATWVMDRLRVEPVEEGETTNNAEGGKNEGVSKAV